MNDRIEDLEQEPDRLPGEPARGEAPLWQGGGAHWWVALLTAVLLLAAFLWRCG